MILEEFAFNPEAIKEWRDLNTITMNFGFHNGAVISSFPKNWIVTLKQKAETDLKGKVEYLKVIEKLNMIKENILIKSGREFNREIDWVNNSIIQQDIMPFYKIIHVDNVAGCSDVIKFENIDEILFLQLREGKIKRDAESFASVSRLLLANSKNIQFIEPHFSAEYSKGFIKSLKAMLIKADVFGRNNIASLQLHTSYKRSRTEVCIKQEKIEIDKYCKTLIPVGQQIEFFWWNDNETAEIHPRCLVTEKGGIRFDRGIVEPNRIDQREAETDVSMLTTAMATLISQKYREESSTYNVVDKYVLQGEG
ncbi:MAG: hypothetical protein NTW54_08735 [Bacteroidetes bacterium]|nr:hypothetical protein [Bacteroidota bacterium]